MCSGVSLTRIGETVAARSQESGVRNQESEVRNCWRLLLVSGGEAAPFDVGCWMFELPVRLGLKMRMMMKKQSHAIG
jgi:hypothetical protein